MDIIDARNISFEDVKKLNPGVNLGTFNNGEKLKLPPGKYTVREKEMLQGCGILPAETVNPFKVRRERKVIRVLDAFISFTPRPFFCFFFSSQSTSTVVHISHSCVAFLVAPVSF